MGRKGVDGKGIVGKCMEWKLGWRRKKGIGQWERRRLTLR